MRRLAHLLCLTLAVLLLSARFGQAAPAPMPCHMDAAGMHQPAAPHHTGCPAGQCGLDCPMHALAVMPYLGQHAAPTCVLAADFAAAPWRAALAWVADALGRPPRT